MKRNLVIGVAVVVLCGGVAGLSLSGALVKSVSFTALAPGERIEVYGILDQKSIHPVKKGANLVTFDLIEEKTNVRLKVVYDNPSVALPATFPAASHAKAAGYYDPVLKRFTSDTVLTKCPSKYDSKSLDLDKQQAVKKWQQETGLAEKPGPSNGA
jgi:cytochrome c-type biogenesis protein CcmE